MALTPEQKYLVSEVRDAEIQWRVNRWFELLLYAVFAVGGFLLPYEDARIFGIVGILFLVNSLRGWKGDPTRRLLLSLAKKLEEQEDDA